jgi:hypothetical protein
MLVKLSQKFSIFHQRKNHSSFNELFGACLKLRNRTPIAPHFLRLSQPSGRITQVLTACTYWCGSTINDAAGTSQALLCDFLYLLTGQPESASEDKCISTKLLIWNSTVIHGNTTMLVFIYSAKYREFSTEKTENSASMEYPSLESPDNRQFAGKC